MISRKYKYKIGSKLKTFTSPWIVLTIDLVLVTFSYFIAALIKYSFSLYDAPRDFVYQIPTVLGVYLVVFLLTKSYRGVIRFTNSNDISRVGLAVLLSFAILWSIDTFLYNNSVKIHNTRIDLKRSTLLIHLFINLSLLIACRIIYAYVFFRLFGKIKEKNNVLIFGAGEMGAVVKNMLQQDERSTLRNVTAFIDDNVRKTGKLLLGKKIIHISNIDEAYITENDITEIYIAINKLRPKRLNQITQIFLDYGVKPKLIPPLKDWVNGALDFNQIKDVRIEDLLTRDVIALRQDLWEKELNNKTILVTGGAGSIGSEIVRQLSNFKVHNIIILDHSESGLYNLEQELKSKKQFAFTPIVASVYDLFSCENIFKTYEPEIIFHAAAYKHVPLMETFPRQAIAVNLGGAKVISDLAVKYEAERFVMVSTDKAVNPTNVMGATKRAAEIYIGTLSKTQTRTKFMTTRFGNVLGSNGSVIPLFKKQIEKGGPITLTHKDIIRYFMTIPEASQLVIEAGISGKGGEIFVFDMGQPVKIYDLAVKMIRLSGLKYPADIDIEITGLRPGEKLFEELLSQKENILPTHHKKINIAKVSISNIELSNQLINNLLKNLFQQDVKVLITQLKQLIPEYISNNSVFETLDTK